MKEQNREIPYVQEFDGIDFKALFRKLFREWKVILKWCGVAVVLALIVGYSIPKKFTVTSRMSLESSSGSGGGGTLSTLAGMAGINLGSLTSSSDLISPDLYPEILSSTPFALELFPVPVEFKDKKGEMIKISYYEYVRDYMRTPWWNAVIHAPSTVLGWVLGLFSKKTGQEEADIADEFDFSRIDPHNLNLEQAGVAGGIWKAITWSVDKKTSAIRLSVSAQNPDVAMQVSEAVVSLLQQYLTNYRTEKARRDLEYYEQLYEEARVDYFQAQQRYADYLDSNQSVIMQRGRAEQDRLRNEMSLAYSLYSSCAQQVQTAKAKVQFDTPAFNMIEPPRVPLDGKPSKKILLFLFVFFGAILSSLWILWGKDAWADLVRKDEEDKA